MKMTFLAALSMMYSTIGQRVPLYEPIRPLYHGSAPLYERDKAWPPAGLPPAASAFSAVAVDNIAKEVHVIQRGPHMPPMLVLSTETGRLIRTYGNRSTITFANGTWGSHGLSIRFPTDGKEPQLWVFDFFAGKIRVFSTQGELLSTVGSTPTLTLTLSLTHTRTLTLTLTLILTPTQ